MRIDERVRQRVAELIESGSVIARSTPQHADPAGRAMIHECSGWIASAANLLSTLQPDTLSEYRQQARLLQIGTSKTDQVGGLVQILKHLLIDVDAGVVSRVADAARAEVFDDFLDQAAYWLRGNRWQQSGVLAGVVFEDALRRACDRLSIPQKGIDLEQLIVALNKREVINEIQAKRARVAAGVRTKATHAQWDEFCEGDVDATIRFTRELIDTVLN